MQNERVSGEYLQDGPSSERKIIRLCEYASKNPVRIPKVWTLHPAFPPVG